MANDPDPRVAAEATDSWGKALTWLGANRADLARFDRYIARYPDDAAVVRAREKARTDIARAGQGRGTAGAPAAAFRDRYGEARAEGFKFLEANDNASARERFEFALKGKRRDPDALGGLGVILMREGRFEEARDNLRRAAGASRSARSRWGEALASAEFWSSYREADAARQAGDFGRAEALARALEGKGGQDAALVQQLLGDALIGQGRFAEAEQAFRQALAQAPGNTGAELGLFNALLGQNRLDEAAAFSQQMSGQAQAQVGDISGLRASALRDDAERAASAGQDQEAFSRLQQALTLDPNNPWVRLDMARLLAAHGDLSQATGLIEPMANAPGATLDMLQAAAVFYDEQGMQREAVAVARRIPGEQQTADVRAMVDRVTFSAEVARAKALAESGARQQAIAALNQLATRANTPGRQGQIAAALAEAGAPHRALRMVRRQIAETGGLQDVDSQILYAGALVSAGQEAEANAIIMQALQRGGLTPAQQSNIAGVQRSLVVRQADRARERGAYADAYDLLYPHLAANPRDADLLSALARVYTSAGYNSQAQTIYAQVLEVRPTDLGAIRGAIGSAIQANDLQTASLLLDQAIKAHPTDPHIYFLLGEAASAKGDRTTARNAYLTAKKLREDELRASMAAGSPIEGTLPPNPFTRVGMPAGSYVPPMPVPTDGSAGGMKPADGRNPFERSSLGDEFLQGGDGGRTLAGDPRGDTLLAQTYTGAPNSPYNNAGTNNPVFVPRPPEPGRAYQPSASDVYLPAFINPAERNQYAEPTLTEQIDARLQSMNANRGHFVQGGVAVRARDGDGGLDRLTEIQTPVSYTFVPQEIGSITLSATPTYITAGSLEGNEANLRRFGTNAVANTGAVPNPGTIQDSGVGLNLAFDGGVIKGDIGVTPLGFEEINPVGGITFAPKLNKEVELQFTLQQRAVTDSVLSYAGLEDPNSGAILGGVVRRGGTIGGSFDVGDYGAYVSGGYYFLEGRNVQDNEMAEATIGAYVRVIDRPDEELKIGGNLTFFGYDQNLRHFSSTHGGYFSPQSYASISAPIEYTRQEGPLTFQVGGAIGIQRFEEDGAQVFPGSAQLTNLLNAKNTAGSLGGSAILAYDSEEQTSLGFNGYGRMEYAVADRTTVGVGARLDAAADWFEGTAFLYLRQSLGKNPADER